METLLAVADHRNQYYSKNKSQRFGSSPAGGFRQINCRSFESGGGLLPSPIKVCSTPLSNGYLSSPRTPSHTRLPTAYEDTPYHWKSGDVRLSRGDVKSSPIPVNFKGGKKERPHNQNTPFSERWAGPTYSNSPPPSSVPLPKFWLKPKRSVSLELPPTETVITPHPIAKSAPASPTRGSKQSAVTFLRNEDNATKTLRRILNLDVADD